MTEGNEGGGMRDERPFSRSESKASRHARTIGEAPVAPGRGGPIRNTRSGKWRQSKKIQRAMARRKANELQESQWEAVMRMELDPEWFAEPLEDKAQAVGLTPEAYDRYARDPTFLVKHKDAVLRFTQSAEGKPLLMLWKKAAEGNMAAVHLYGTKMLWFKEAYDREQQRKNLRLLRQFLTMQRDDLPDPEEVLGEAHRLPERAPEEADDGHDEGEEDVLVRGQAEHPRGRDAPPDQPRGDGWPHDERVEPPAGGEVRGQPPGAWAAGTASVEPIER